MKIQPNSEIHARIDSEEGANSASLTWLAETNLLKRTVYRAYAPAPPKTRVTPSNLLGTLVFGESTEITAIPPSPERRPKTLVLVRGSLRTNEARIAMSTGPTPITSESSLAVAYLTPNKKKAW